MYLKIIKRVGIIFNCESDAPPMALSLYEIPTRSSEKVRVIIKLLVPTPSSAFCAFKYLISFNIYRDLQRYDTFSYISIALL